MILFNLGSVQSYVGLEPAKSAVEFVNKAIKALPNLAGRAEVHIGTATDLDQLSGLRPDLHVEILPKNMEATNELSAYRYAAVVHLRDLESERPVYPIAFQMRSGVLGAHLWLLASAETVAVGRIPHDKTIFERLIVESLDDTRSDASQRRLDGAPWISAVRSDAESRASLSMPDLVQLAAESGFQVQFPDDNQLRDAATLTNRPLQRLQRRRVAAQIRQRLQALVPSYMIPAKIGPCSSLVKRFDMFRPVVVEAASSVRVLLCLFHALYDGLSLEHVVRDLHMLYKGRSLLPATQFLRYMQYMDYTREAGCDFWRDVIQDTPITVLGDVGANHGGRELQVGAARTLHATKIIGIPLQAVRSSSSSSITQAPVFNAACALVLSRETGAKDVVFGRIVLGRQGLPVSWENIVGPCANAVPVRARIDDNESDDHDHNHRQMPRDMQGHCTNWPATANNYACCVTYHDFAYHPEGEMEQQRVEMGVLARKDALLKEEPVYDLGIAGEVEPDGVHLQVTVVAKTRLFSKERASCLMEQVCREFESLNSAL
ncbi:hypothetical protein G3M48_000544 [Beauveria asiatica]|uniref:Condensation domain-containing protein n=1 Tax=Beauveria asiatica TaxID=1069075 RepID=A0AAW0S0L5_9HYPO